MVGNFGGREFWWLEILVVGNHLVDFSPWEDLVDLCYFPKDNRQNLPICKFWWLEISVVGNNGG